jgi:uncharacterized protein (TIGR03437 family)
VSAESIATAFGDRLSPATGEAATLPLPTSLAGLTLTITDSRSIERPAPLFYISPGQVNFLVPPGVAPGQARVAIFNGPVLRSTARIQVDPVAPALFTRDASGTGLAAATAVRVAADGAVTLLDVAALDFGDSGDTVYLTLYGTGIRNRAALSAVSATVGGVSARVDYAGAQGQFVGLDQVNLALPRELAGLGALDVVLTVASRAASPVQVVAP